jgi:hypothetical protein
MLTFRRSERRGVFSGKILVATFAVGKLRFSALAVCVLGCFFGFGVEGG